MRLFDSVPNEDIAAALREIAARPRALTSGILDVVAATGDQDIKTTATLWYTVNNRFYTQAAETLTVSGTTAGLAATAGTGVQAAGTVCAYLVTYDVSTNYDILKGDDAATAALALAALPAPADNTCPVGVWLVANTTNSFIAGTTKDSATGVSFTFYDISDIPYGWGEGAVYLDTADE